MIVKEVLQELSKLGNDSTKKILIKHGAREPFYGVKIGDLKKIQREIKKDYRLSLDLFKTGNSDAMYLAGLIADEEKITKEDLQEWVEEAYWYLLSEYTVPSVAAESRYGEELAMEWIESGRENVASAGWSTIANIVSVKPDIELNLREVEALLERVQREMHQSPNRVRYAMNGFVIAVGVYIPELTEMALRTAEKIGKVNVDMGGTACKVPSAAEYIEKVRKLGKIGNKRKTSKH